VTCYGLEWAIVRELLWWDTISCWNLRNIMVRMEKSPGSVTKLAPIATGATLTIHSVQALRWVCSVVNNAKM
jgi:hypothetical protein